jgi:hypothetical protein
VSKLTEYENKAGIGQKRVTERGPSLGNSGQRSIIKDLRSITPLNVDEANGHGANEGKEPK